MTNQTHHESDLLTLSTFLFFDLPLAETRRLFGLATEKEVIKTRWKSYDAGVRTLTNAIDMLYRDPLFGRTLDLWLQMLLRWQQLNKVVLGTIVTGTRELGGLPTAAHIEALRAEIHAATLSHTRANSHQEAADGPPPAASLGFTPGPASAAPTAGIPTRRRAGSLIALQFVWMCWAQ